MPPPLSEMKVDGNVFLTTFFSKAKLQEYQVRDFLKKSFSESCSENRCETLF